jgi:ABC-2 type transport system ATP-binding protein
MSSAIIRVQKVSKSFGKVKALDNISLEVEPGTIYGLLGPNGAGKTTLIRLLSTLITPDSGRLEIAGLNVVDHAPQVRSLIGLAGQFAAVDEFMTGRETLEMVAALYHIPRAEAKRRAAELLEKLSLTDAADRTARTYSGGMRRRLDVGASLVIQPKVIFLDEPTTGLAPRTRLEIWEVIRGLARDGSTILLTTQYLEEADALANYITVIDKGRIATQGTAAQLKNSLGRDVVEVHFEAKNRAKAKQVLEKFDQTDLKEDELTGALSLPAKQGSKTLLAVAEALRTANLEPEEISLHRPSLDDVFLAVTGHRATTETTK